MLTTEGISMTMATTAPPVEVGDAPQHLVVEDGGHHLIPPPTEAGIPKSVKHRKKA